MVTVGAAVETAGAADVMAAAADQAARTALSRAIANAMDRFVAIPAASIAGLTNRELLVLPALQVLQLKHLTLLP